MYKQHADATEANPVDDCVLKLLLLYDITCMKLIRPATKLRSCTQCDVCMHAHNKSTTDLQSLISGDLDDL